MHRFARCLIHIGAPKTGTTSLQDVLAANRRVLRARGILYPACFGGRSHVRLAAALHPGPSPQLSAALEATGTADRAALWDVLRAAYAQELRAALAEAAAEGRPPPDTLALSSEFFWSLPDGPPMLEALRNFAAEQAGRLEVFAWIRRQDEFAVSIASTRARDGKADAEAPVFPANPRRAFRYARVMKEAKAAFGRDAITLRIFARGELVGGDIVEDAFAAMGLGATDGLARPPRRNRALRPEMQSWLARLAEIAPDRYGRGAGERIDIGRLAERHAGGGARPARAAAARFMAMFEKANEALRAEWLPERETLFPPPPRWPREADPPADAAALMAVTHDALCWKEAEIAGLAARLALAEGREEEAWPAFARAAALWPAAPGLARAWAEALLGARAAPTDSCRAAAAALEEAAREATEDGALRLRLLRGRLLLRAGDAEAALAAADALEAERPGHDGVRRLAAAARGARRPKRAAAG
ncbi:hypothetical protein ACQ5SO_10950 [Rhodovulum sp. DZ06]|uniref:hypothetical protein n=1 Tax=Rhodovulum sp. DZ06 TaxID=3425126 RepID=UPI003D32EB62